LSGLFDGENFAANESMTDFRVLVYNVRDLARPVILNSPLIYRTIVLLFNPIVNTA
jgi:hypothetical protein